MLNKIIFYQPEKYPEQPVIFLEEMHIPLGDYTYCQNLENKINEYSDSIGLVINLFILKIEKNIQELYREPDEIAWSINKEFDITEMNNTIILEHCDKDTLLKSYALFEPLFRLQLENIYHFLKTNYRINEYFTKKCQYELLRNKYTITKKDNIKKI